VTVCDSLDLSRLTAGWAESSTGDWRNKYFYWTNAFPVAFWRASENRFCLSVIWTTTWNFLFFRSGIPGASEASVYALLVALATAAVCHVLCCVGFRGRKSFGFQRRRSLVFTSIQLYYVQTRTSASIRPIRSRYVDFLGTYSHTRWTWVNYRQELELVICLLNVGMVVAKFLYS